MPSKHSKNAGDRHYYSAHERSKNNIGSQHQRLGTDSQLPFGYCCLSLQPIKDAVITPSGHMYSREAMIAYLLTKTQELKEQTKLFELEQQKNARDADDAIEADRQSTINQFTSQLDGNSVSQSKRKATDERSNINDKNPQTMDARRRVIDDTTTEQKIAELRVVCPWVPQFTPNAAPAAVKAPPKRPASPCSGQPLRSKDLMPGNHVPSFLTLFQHMIYAVKCIIIVNLVKESDAKARSDTGAVRFICPVSR